MGGDLGPAEMVEAVKLALAEFPGLNPINLVGDEAVLQPLLRSANLDRHPLLTVTHASEVITPEDEVMQAIKRKRDASMLRAIDLVKSGEAGAVVSTGNTKILVAAGTLKLRTLDGVERPALAPIVPREGGHFILIDGGANPEAKAQHLVHNAILGTHYCRVVLGIEKPRVGLLTIGTEENKGNVRIEECGQNLCGYAVKTGKTLSRDVNTLVKMGLIAATPKGYEAQRQLILSFLPPRATPRQKSEVLP